MLVAKSQTLALTTIYILLCKVEMMVLGEDGRASSTLLLRAVPSLKRKLSHLDAQTFLRALVRDKWFEELVRTVLCTENVAGGAN